MKNLTLAEVTALSENHDLQELLQGMFMSSLTYKQKQFKQMVAMDRAIKAFKTRTDSDGNIVEGERLDPSEVGQDYLQDVNIPLMFMLLDMFDAQFNKMFFSQDKIFSYAGQQTKDVLGAKKMTNVIMAAGKHPKFQNAMQLKLAMHNGMKYGYGMVMMTWDTVMANRYNAVGGGKAAIPYKQISGAKYVNISPYRIISDPAMPMDRTEDMRYLGYWYPMSKLNIQRIYGVKIPENQQYNWMFNANNGGDQFSQLFGLTHLKNTHTLVAEVYVDMIPEDYKIKPKEEWGASYDGSQPQVFHMVMAGYDRILVCEPANLPTRKYPFYSVVPDGDGYELSPTSRLSRVKDMEAEFNWMHNSHMYAVRQGLGGDLIVDTKIVRVDDIEKRDKNRPVNIFRIAEEYEGIPGIGEKAITQLKTQDNTTSHVQDGSTLIELMKSITGATDPMLGQDNPSSRRTAEEYATVVENAGNRIVNVASRIHHTFMAPLGHDTAVYTQHFLDHEMVARITADATAPGEVVQWEDILVDFMTIVGDGYLQLDDKGLQESWQTIITTVFQSARLTSCMNLVAMIQRYGEVRGITDMESFISAPGVANTVAAATQEADQQDNPQQQQQ